MSLGRDLSLDLYKVNLSTASTFARYSNQFPLLLEATAVWGSLPIEVAKQGYPQPISNGIKLHRLCVLLCPPWSPTLSTLSHSRPQEVLEGVREGGGGEDSFLVFVVIEGNPNR